MYGHYDLKKICVQLTSIISFIHYAATMSGYYAFLLLFLLLVISLKIVPLNQCCKLCFFLLTTKICTINVCVSDVLFFLLSTKKLHCKCVFFRCVFFSCYQPRNCTYKCVFSCLDMWLFACYISLEIVPVNV
ncbi:hypothetical protein PVAP13_3KG052500 [Panicum virgatum]|uniref:Uncharacterized protein n=1 Tax=Panicum virgatum TaxID=38727 RepID=A0A8T0UL88_PANVG|nr:hypothetical protein PVAP13_3KG052500 [Panicum virgatum]